jgi:glyoxylase-like metal-dependent hydrolase (beta-lactamase superfamily II)
VTGLGADPEIRAFFDEPTNTVTYLVWDPGSRHGVAIDPVLDFDPASGMVNDDSVAELLTAAEAEGVTIDWVLETHIHADHLSGAPLIKARTGARIAIGEHVREVQNIFRPIFGAADVKDEGGDFDRLLGDGEKIEVGGMSIEVIHTPGHTPACVSYRIGKAVFVGDTLFMPDYGTARTDFPGGDARSLYRSIHKLLALPPETRLFMCHDYKAPGRDHFAWETTVAAERTGNRHVHDGIAEDEFVAMREERDRSLCTPRLLIPSIQVNMRAGRFPPADEHGVRYLRVPVTLKAGTSPRAIS